MSDGQQLLAITIGLAIVLVVAAVCILLLAVWLPRDIAKMVLFEQSQRNLAKKGQTNAEAERDALHEAARAEVTRLVAMVCSEERARARAEEERDATEKAARELIRKAFTEGQGSYARLVDELRQGLPSISAIAHELRRDEESGRALLWHLWRLLSEACPGMAPPPEPPMFTRTAGPPETAPATKDERRALVPLTAPVSAEDEARIAARLDVLLSEAKMLGQAVGHCHGVYCEEGGRCECGCAPCVGWEQLRTQAEREVAQAALQAAHLTPQRPTAFGLGGDARVEPDSSRTLASMKAAAPLSSRMAPPVVVEDRTRRTHA